MTFDLQNFVDDCVRAGTNPGSSQAIRELVAEAVSRPGQLEQALGTPTRSGIQRLHVAPQLTVLNVIWAPGMTLMPHNHNMWAVIGVYGGREDNIFWRRQKDDSRGRIEAAGAKSLGAGDVRPLGENIIHSVTNPTSRLTGAIHIYGGDFFAKERSEWDPESLEERPYDIDANVRRFERANALLKPLGD